MVSNIYNLQVQMFVASEKTIFLELDLNENNVLIIDCKGNVSEWDSIRSSIFSPDFFPVSVFDVDLKFVQSRERPELERPTGFRFSLPF